MHVSFWSFRLASEKDAHCDRIISETFADFTQKAGAILLDFFKNYTMENKIEKLINAKPGKIMFEFEIL